LLEADDELVLIAEDDSAYMVLDRPVYDDGNRRPWPPSQRHGCPVSAMDAVVAAEARILEAQDVVEAREARDLAELRARHDFQDAAEDAAMHAAVRASLGSSSGGVGGDGGGGRCISDEENSDAGVVATSEPVRKLPPIQRDASSSSDSSGVVHGDLTPITPSQHHSNNSHQNGQSSPERMDLVNSAAAPHVQLPSRRRHEGFRVLICGWRRDVKDMITLMDKILPPGSIVTILSERWIESKDFENEYLRDNCPILYHITVRHSFGRADVRRRLVESNSLGFGSPDYEVDVIVVVADESKEKDMLLSDSQTIASCLLVRDVQADELEHRDVSLADLSRVQLEALQVSCPMTAEILDVATRATIEENPAIKAIADFVVVNDLAARLIAAVADRREVASVLGELLGADPKSQDIFVVEASMLLYEDELLKHRHSACIDVGGNPQRDPELVRRHAKRAPPAAAMLVKHKALLDRASEIEAADAEVAETDEKGAQQQPQTPERRTSHFADHSGGGHTSEKHKPGEARPVSFAEMAARASAPPRHGILLGYIKASWNAKEDCVGDLATVFNPQSKVNHATSVTVLHL
jgi:hypothetical protein